MVKSNNLEKFLTFRKEFPVFIYKGFDFQYSDKGLRAQFHFNLADKYSFHPVMVIPLREFFIKENIRKEILENMIFHIGMIELISYWKAACPPLIRIECGSLDEEQVKWWKKLYYHGLGEFFYLNSINTGMENFVTIDSHAGLSYPPFSIPVREQAIIPIGGGKDSIVTFELLGQNMGNIPMVINPRPASSGILMKRGIYYDSVIEISRTIDPVLLKLNEKGFLNGHTPFSALLAFVSVLAASMSGRKYIALSNESSANESTIPGSDINHQYSKSTAFEGDFRWYVNKYISPDIDYFSFLRPLNELQIARIFSGLGDYHSVFKSCNAGSKTNTWCGKCPKCLFTYLILSPFMKEEKLESVFGKNLLNDPELIPLMNELAGISQSKPFDCIGTIDEVNTVLVHLVREIPEDKLPVILRQYRSSGMYERYQHSEIKTLLDHFNTDHFLPKDYESLLRSHLDV